MKVIYYYPNNEYYTDQCYPYTTDNGTDILLNDRYDEYNNNNMALCENNCTLEKYEEDTKKVICECKIKMNDLCISEYINDTDLLYYNFTSNDLSLNMVSMKCIYILFSKDGIVTNIASYIFIIFVIFFIISGILFYKCGYPILEEIIQDIVKSKQQNKENKMNQENKPKIYKMLKKRKKTKKRKSKLNLKNNNIDLTIHKKMNKTKSILLKPELTINKMEKIKKENNENNEKINNLNEIIKINNSSDFKEYELNSLLYADALKYDKRTFYEYYISLIKRKHSLIFPFTKDYNSLIIKFDLIVISFSIQYFFNALFFNESTIHEIYEGKGNYNIIDLAPFIFYSFIFSRILDIIIKYLSLSERNIINIKKQESVIGAFNILDKERKALNIKYISFYVIILILFLFFWYYLSSFSAVYQNSQIYLIKNVLICFVFSLLYPFLFNFIPTYYIKNLFIKEF